MKEKLTVMCFTGRGLELAKRLTAAMPDREAEIYEDRSGAKEFVAAEFQNRQNWIFIGACGIAVRFCAPYLRGKAVDPCVIVLDEAGRFVIPVLSGHLGGGNALALEIAERLGAEPVITTATDVRGAFAADVWARSQGLEIINTEAIKKVSSAVLRGEKVGFCSDFAVSGDMPTELTDGSLGASAGICVSYDEKKKPFAETLNVTPRNVWLGVGCRKGEPAPAAEKFLLDVLSDEGVSLKSVKGLASIDIKAEEPCILEFCRKYGLEFRTYSGEELSEADEPAGGFSGSEFVKGVTGVDNVCERSAALAAGGGDRLIFRKRSGNGMTCAAAGGNIELCFGNERI